MKFEHFIVKSWEDDYPNLALNEYFCMRAIQYANLPTPEFYFRPNTQAPVAVNEQWQVTKIMDQHCMLSTPKEVQLTLLLHQSA